MAATYPLAEAAAAHRALATGHTRGKIVLCLGRVSVKSRRPVRRRR